MHKTGDWCMHGWVGLGTGACGWVGLGTGACGWVGLGTVHVAG